MHVIAGALTSLVGCATTFTGDPHVENGRAGCDAKCNAQGMATSGMVFMGEYSSACICEVPRPAGAPAAAPNSAGAAAGGAAGAAGVILQMERARQQQQDAAARR